MSFRQVHFKFRVILSLQVISSASEVIAVGAVAIVIVLYNTLRKHSYRKFHLQKTENFQIKKKYFFYISAQNIDCGYPLEPPRRGGSNEYPQSMFLNRNKKNNVYPCKP